MAFHFWLTTSFVASTALDTAFLAASHLSLMVLAMPASTGVRESLMPVHALLISPPIRDMVELMPLVILSNAPRTVSLQASQI